jgi:hypothetical protein
MYCSQPERYSLPVTLMLSIRGTVPFPRSRWGRFLARCSRGTVPNPLLERNRPRPAALGDGSWGAARNGDGSWGAGHERTVPNSMGQGVKVSRVCGGVSAAIWWLDLVFLKPVAKKASVVAARMESWTYFMSIAPPARLAALLALAA